MRWLRTSGAQVDASGRDPVRLRGVGIGGWLDVENFITGLPPAGSVHRRALRKALGPHRNELLFESLVRNFFGQYAAFIASLGECIAVRHRVAQDDLCAVGSRPTLTAGETAAGTPERISR